jgi:AbrB family looped-hinge helix DNA binding protein
MLPFKYHMNTTTTTIDKAGRIVIPKDLREKAGLEPGTEIEISHDGVSIRIQRAVQGPKIERVGGRLVARPAAPKRERPELDLAAVIRGERDRWPR